MKVDLDKLKEAIVDIKNIQLKYIDAESMYIYHALDETLKKIVHNFEVLQEAFNEENKKEP